MSEDDNQSNQQKGSSEPDETSDVSKDDSLPLNETPPAPPEKTTEADFTESCEGIAVFVQAEGDHSSQEDE